MDRLSDAEVWAWVEASCARQKLEPRVSDPITIRRIAVLILGRDIPPLSDPPDRLHAIGVEAVEAASAWADDGVVHDGLDDGSLPGQWEGGPLSA